MKRLILAVAATLSAGVASAQPVCGASYEIQSGDTLSLVAARALNDSSLWQRIYQFGGNARVIGLNPNLVIPGFVIEIPPCAGGAAPTGVQGAAAAARSAPAGAAPARSASGLARRPAPDTSAAGAREIEVLSPGDIPPIADERWDSGGLATQLVEAAFARSLPDENVRIDFVGDRSAHLGLLLRYNKFEFGFPWTKPDCSAPSALPEDSQILCEYEFSDPLYVAAIKVYAPKNLVGAPQSFDGLKDSILCRTIGSPVHDLAQHGLIDGQTIKIERPSSTEQCFTMLERGEVDYVSEFQFSAEQTLADMGLTDFVAPLPGIGRCGLPSPNRPCGQCRGGVFVDAQLQRRLGASAPERGMG